MGETRGRVLVADDDEDLLRLFSAMLTRRGYQVATAADGRAALELLGHGGFQAVLSDVHMPGLDGLQLLRAVRERDLDVPVVLVTASGEVDHAIQAIEYGAVRYVRKPATEKDLVGAVDEAVRLGRVAALKRQALQLLGHHDRLVGDRAGLEASFQAALESLRIAYQPVVRARDGGLHGHEALVRTAAAALPDPGALFDAAGRLGLLEPLGRALRGAVSRSMPGPDDLATFVNLHPFDLRDPGLYEPDAPLSRCASRVVLEITERSSLDGVPDVRGRVRELRQLGYRIAIDDMGTGYAGLQSFTALSPDVAKLDVSLVRGLDGDPVRRKLVGSLASVCRDLGIVVLAEGVETAQERDALVEQGCDLLQGYFFGRPQVWEGSVAP